MPFYPDGDLDRLVMNLVVPEGMVDEFWRKLRS